MNFGNQSEIELFSYDIFNISVGILYINGLLILLKSNSISFQLKILGV